ncbi:MAG: deoxyribose-phosphate aldolase [halophilic archaeon J07HX5]|jgi:deoxyribose-phosphate aldolase|nr:MAG: deoxyribose-phosphate aldolase [halophilic archaeon J07HX5]
MELASRIEHTVLGPTTTWEAVADGLDEANQHGMRACVPPCYVDRATDYAPTVPVTTVIGFPHGHHPAATKRHEAERAQTAGAAELDMVANLGRLQSEEIDAVTADIAEVVAAVSVPIKVIVEAPLLTEATLRRVCDAACTADADFLKTATGVTDGGATVADVELMSEYLPVKASGGVGSWSFANRLFDVGAERIGASRGTTIVREYNQTEEQFSAGAETSATDR